MRSRRILIGRTRWLRSGIRLLGERMALTVVISALTTNLKPEAPYPITLQRQVHLRRAFVLKFLRPSRKKDRKNLTGTPQLRVIKKLQRIA